MEKFQQIDEKLTPIINELEDIVFQYDIETKHDFQIEFCLTDDVDKIVTGINKSEGIYFFEIENKDLLPFVDWYNDFNEKWNSKTVSNLPNLSTSRSDSHKDSEKPPKRWIPLYIGRSKSLPKRLKQHIEGYSSTSSLRLKQHDFPKNYGFRITILYLGDLVHYDVISTIVESELRNKLNPIVGKQ